jgi:hypothetical protein
MLLTAPLHPASGITADVSFGCRYMLVQEKAAWVMKVWVPLLIGAISLACIVIEARVGLQYLADIFDADFAKADYQVCRKSR